MPSATRREGLFLTIDGGISVKLSWQKGGRKGMRVGAKLLHVWDGRQGEKGKKITPRLVIWERKEGCRCGGISSSSEE